MGKNPQNWTHWTRGTCSLNERRSLAFAYAFIGSLFEKRTNVSGFWVSKLKHRGDFGCLQKMAEKLSESSEFEEFLKLVQEVAIKILSQISSIKP